MDILGTVDTRNTQVRHGLIGFAIGLIGYVVTVNLLFFVWLGGAEFWSVGSLEAMAWMAGIVLGIAAIQMWRLARDGREISTSLGGVALSKFANEKRHIDKAKQLQNIVSELCIGAASPTPSIYIQPGKHYINGFACGIQPTQWCITVTEGALAKLSRDEMQALIGHELAHLITGDTKNSMLLCSYIAGFSSISIIGLAITA